MPHRYDDENNASVEHAHFHDPYTHSDMPSSFHDRSRGTTSSAYGDPDQNGDPISKRIADERAWLRKMKQEVRRARRKQRAEQESATLLCCVLRASSALLTERAAHTRSRRPFRCAIDSFLDGTPFMTKESLCRYNTTIADALSDEYLDLLRCHVFNYDEAAFAELLYADDLDMDKAQGARGRVPEAVVQFNERSRRALELLFAAPGGLADAVMHAARAVPVALGKDKMEGGGYENGHS